MSYLLHVHACSPCGSTARRTAGATPSPPPTPNRPLTEAPLYYARPLQALPASMVTSWQAGEFCDAAVCEA